MPEERLEELLDVAVSATIIQTKPAEDDDAEPRHKLLTIAHSVEENYNH